MEKKQMVNLARLEKLIKDRGWGIGELAEYSGVKYDTVYSIVKGRRQNTSAVLLKPIAETLGTTVDYLLEHDTAGEIVSSAPQPPTTVRRLASVAERLSELRQEELLRIAATFEKMEAEEAKLDIPDDAMRELMALTKGLGPHATAKNLITALGMIFGNQKGGWMVDLGGTRPGGPDNPTEGE